MIKWVMGVLGAVIAGVLVFWLTEGLHAPPIESPPDTFIPSPEVPPDEIARRIEELQGHLGNNENEQERVLREIEHLRSTRETDPDTWRAIESLEGELEQIRMERQPMEDEFNRLREQR